MNPNPKRSTLRGKNSLGSWKRQYAVVMGGEVCLWKSLSAALTSTSASILVFSGRDSQIISAPARIKGILGDQYTDAQNIHVYGLKVGVGEGGAFCLA